MTAGRSTARTTVASSKTAAARPTPICFIDTCDNVPNTENTATMMTAALVTTPAVEAMPRSTASLVDRPRLRFSTIRLTMKTW